MTIIKTYQCDYCGKIHETIWQVAKCEIHCYEQYVNNTTKVSAIDEAEYELYLEDRDCI